ncbi:hypothetical protein N9Y41_00940 [Planktomarina temperata]|nr:hypothetical protein [Planktomarina temperata]
MKQLVLGAALVGTGILIGALSSHTTNGTANAQFAPPSGQSGDALWHLPYPQIAVGITTDMPELFKRHLKRYRQMNVASLKP